MSEPIASNPYRLNVGMVLVYPKNGIFSGKRIKPKSAYWQMPQGGVDTDEDLATAALRELEEEIGTNQVQLLHESKHWYAYDFPEAFLTPPNTLWDGKYRGQRQRWFLCAFLGTDDAIHLNTLHPEFCAWKWASPETIIQEAVPFKQAIYQAVLDEFWPSIRTFLGKG